MLQMLIEKEIEFDTMLINLRDKPEWYVNVAANSKTPAICIDGEYICESMDIMTVGSLLFDDTLMLLAVVHWPHQSMPLFLPNGLPGMYYTCITLVRAIF